MSADYSIELCKELQAKFEQAELCRPMRIGHYEPGTELTYPVQSVGTGAKATVRLVINRFVGGGFAGQVYQVRILDVASNQPEQVGFQPDQLCAMKILIPPSGFSLLFRNVLYRIGFQGPFQLQVNPDAARAGALWQKFIRRAAGIRFGSENAVVDIYATFVDENLGSCGELSEWIDGRTWQLEVDNRLDLLAKWKKGNPVDSRQLGSPEYRAKKIFMAEFVNLLREIGAPEFARQYEWSTCKSQPNCLKRRGFDDDPQAGLTAVDFRAGLALLPFLPMSPGDFSLIGRGLKRGSLVQFDRGDPDTLEAFIQAHREQFDDLLPALEQLRQAEQVYRNSLPDITHNHIRLLYSRSLWSTMLSSAVTGWRVRNLIDDRAEQTLRRSKLLVLLAGLLSMIPWLGRGLIKLWGRSDWRRHYLSMMVSWDYLARAVRGRMAEKLIFWHRAGRIAPGRAEALSQNIPRFLCHLPLSILPAGLHRILTDQAHLKSRLAYFLVRPVRLYFDAELRRQWLRDMLDEGRKKHMLSESDATIILSQIDEPFIQKYLKSLAVHVCTLPVTQVVSVLLAVIYVLTHPDMPRGQAWGVGVGIIALFQVTPISPGSLVRGLYVLYLVIRERNFKDYNIAVFLGFFKYIGYLAFPIQMTCHYPALARFMAGHWATEAVHVVPVFGERGALMEHWVFCLFYNWPLTLRRRMAKRAEQRALLKPRYWHLGLCAAIGAALLTLAEYIYMQNVGVLPHSKIWWLAVPVPLALTCGAAVTLGCGGAAMWKRIVSATVSGIAVAGLSVLATGLIVNNASAPHLIGKGIWQVFALAIFATLGALVTEFTRPEPGPSTDDPISPTE